MLTTLWGITSSQDKVDNILQSIMHDIYLNHIINAWQGKCLAPNLNKS